MLTEVVIPEPGTSDARAGKWLGFAYDCECHVIDNNGEKPVKCKTHEVDGRTKTRACGHVLSPDCYLHKGWSPGDTAMIERRPGAFSGDSDIPD